MDLTSLQQIYLVAFSIFLAIMLQSTSNLAPFKTAFAYLYRKTFYRVLLSTGILIILPLVYFVWFFTELDLDTFNFSSENLIQVLLQNLSIIFVIFALALSVYGFQKLWYMFLILGRNYFFADKEQILMDDNKGFFCRDFSQYLFPSLAYILLPILFFYLVVEKLEVVIPLVIGLVIIAIGGLIRRKQVV